MRVKSDYKYTKDGYVKKAKTAQIDYDILATAQFESWSILLSYFRWYPDMAMQICESSSADFSLSLPQRATMRSMVRYRDNFTTATRGYGKTYNIVSVKGMTGLTWPGSVIRYISPSEKQSAPLASAAWKQFKKNYPILGSHYMEKFDSRDHFGIETTYNSVLSTYVNRGDNVTEIVAEEFGQEDKFPFNHDEFRTVMLPTVRRQHMVDKKPDAAHIDFIKTYITSASRQLNPAYATRQKILDSMIAGESAFAIDIPWEVPVMAFMKPYEYYQDLKNKLTPEEFLRECCSRYTGTTENPVVRDETIEASKTLKIAEFEHSGQPDVFYVIGYDISYEGGAKNAKCAVAVVKCEKQAAYNKKNRYLKSLVNVYDMPPPSGAIEQALKLKQVWARYCKEGNNTAYIAIDSNQYGHAVVEVLHTNLMDGLPALCCVNHECASLELRGALPVIYPVRAVQGTGVAHDSDSLMMQYAEVEFENGNIRLLTTDVLEGIRAYKVANKIKDDRQDFMTQQPYRMTKIFCEQISNLKKIPTSLSFSERRISKAILRDMWSAFKYAIRYASKLEDENLMQEARGKSGWDSVIKGIGVIADAQVNGFGLKSRIPGGISRGNRSRNG